MIRIRPYQSEDKPACRRIAASNVPAYFLAKEVEDFLLWLDKPTRGPYFVLEENGVALACGGIYHDTESGTTGLSWGMVHADHHRQGWGEKLTLFRLARLQETWPAHPVALHTSQKTQGFYEKLGFRPVSTQKDAYGPGLDRVDMRRDAPNSGPDTHART